MELEVQIKLTKRHKILHMRIFLTTKQTCLHDLLNVYENVLNVQGPPR